MRRLFIFLTLTLFALPGLRAQSDPDMSDREWVRHPDHGFDIWVSGTEHEHRAATRLFYWSPGRSRGEAYIGYGAAHWDPKLLEGMESLRYGYTWRMASGFWSIFDTNMGLRLGGQPMPPGSYYLGLKRSLDGSKWFLAVMDPDLIRKARIDAYETHLRPIPAQFEVAMQFQEVEEVESQLRIRLKADPDDPRGGSLAIAFGPYRLSADLKLDEVPQIGVWPEHVAGSPRGDGKSLQGAWEGSLPAPNGPFGATIRFDRQNGEPVGWVDIPAQAIYQLRLADLQVSGNRVSFRLPVHRQQITFEGDFDSQELTGTLRVDEKEAPAVLTRR